jgi:hypothetical protein
VFVSKERVSDALDVANELFLSLEDRGHSVTLSSNYQRPELYVREGGEEVRLLQPSALVS